MDDLLKNASAADEKAIQGVFNEVVANIQKFGDTPLGWYRTKQILGDKGKWNISFKPDLAPQKEAYEELYKVINNQMEDLLPDGLFREANENIATALNLKKWATRSEKATLPSGIRFSDPTMDIGLTGSLISAATGNPVGAVSGIAGAAGKDFIESAQGGQVIGKGLEKLGGKIGERNVTLFPGLQGAGASAGRDLAMQVGGRAVGGATMNALLNMPAGQQQAPVTGGIPGLGTQQQAQQQQQPSVEDIYMKKMQLAYIASQYPEIASQVKIAQEMLDAQLSTGDTGAKTDKQRSITSAVEGLGEVQQLLGAGVKTGPLASLGAGISKFTGQPTETAQLGIILDDVNKLMRNAFIGSGMSEAELRTLDLPKSSDQESVIALKIDSLKRRLEGML
jgi:hypothetical protein